MTFLESRTPKTSAARDGFDQPGSTGGGCNTSPRGRDRAYPAPDVSAATSPVAEESAFPAGRAESTTLDLDLAAYTLTIANSIVAGIEHVIANRAMSGCLPSDRMRADLAAARADAAEA